MVEAAAYAYDRAAYKLCGEYTKLNFLNLQDPSQFGLFEDTERLNALKSVVDARIQFIFEKVKREKGNRKKNKKKKMRECESVVKIEDCSSVSCVGSGLMTSPSASEDGFWREEGSQYSVSGESKVALAVAGEVEVEGCSLARLPSYDPELIWEVLAN